MNWLKQNYWLIGILLLAAILRLYHADFQSLWLDEILSMNNSNPKYSFSEFYKSVMFWEFIPHLYFFLLKIVFSIFGYSAIAGRSFSAIIGIAGIYAMYLLGRELGGKKLGLLASALLAVNAYHIAYSQEIRPYGMLVLFTILAFYRLLIFLREQNLRNAIWFGLFTGLIIHAHFFGAITIFSIGVITLYFLFRQRPENRKRFVTLSAIAGIVALVVFLPAYEAMARVSEIKSFWLQKPTGDAFTVMFKDFFGNSEILIFIIQILVLFYFVRLFSKKNDADPIPVHEHSSIRTFLILFIWIAVSLVIPLVRSYLSVPMILGRYFINIVPALVLILALSMDMIRNNAMKKLAIFSFVFISLLDLFVVRQYYHTVTKSQFRELSGEIAKNNPEKHQIVAYWTWLFPYFFKDDPNQPISPNSISLDDYIANLKSQKRQRAFWYADANSRPFAITPANQKWLDENYVMVKKLDFFDAWANHYIPKNEDSGAGNSGELLSMYDFGAKQPDTEGKIALFENAVLTSKMLSLDKGRYELNIRGLSLPKPAIDGQNAHFRVRFDAKDIGEFSLSDTDAETFQRVVFECNGNTKARLQLIYDNDFFKDGKDRNAILYEVKLEKK